VSALQWKGRYFSDSKPLPGSSWPLRLIESEGGSIDLLPLFANPIAPCSTYPAPRTPPCLNTRPWVPIARRFKAVTN